MVLEGSLLYSQQAAILPLSIVTLIHTTPSTTTSQPGFKDNFSGILLSMLYEQKGFKCPVRISLCSHTCSSAYSPHSPSFDYTVTLGDKLLLSILK